ncbi:hypothetical protein [Paraburkholderia lycopersici]|uniref:Uncharacterized protein n=1 Tax=Paraburkholderia lycopersici TaxID=416944 RepID=A0A1G6JEE8_9BURK|nr:hypothetical protein [Paraburkholderia lycopersici]SDC17154.1 hypothetical protein SAMN05421548_104232 [Paraburkholderia lycopersici]
MRFFITGTLLCVLASTALAGEHYIEIWNPPEARTPGTRANSAAKKAQTHHGAKHKLASADRLTPRKIAEPAVRAPTPTLPAAPGGAGSPARAAPGTGRTPVIPPQIGPDGNVLQVSYRVPAARAQIQPLAH